MKSARKRITMGIGGVVVAALLLAVAAPKAVHAIVSTLVTVANTTANPVPTQAVDNPAKTPFSANGSCSAQFQDSCFAQQFFSVPPGMTAVVQDVSGQCRVSPQGLLVEPPVNISIAASNGIGAGELLIGMNPNPATFGDLTFLTFGRQATLYGVSTAAAPAYFSFYDRQNGGDCAISINGYLVKNQVCDGFLRSGLLAVAHRLGLVIATTLDEQDGVETL